MRILNVNATLDPREGGTIERTYQMSRFLIRAGQDVRILVTDKGLTSERAQEFGDRLIALPTLNARFYLPRPAMGRISRLVSEADVIHLMGHWTVLNILVYALARKLRKPYVFCPAGSLPVWGRSRYIKKFYNWTVGNRIIRHAKGWIAISEGELSDFEEYGIDPARVQCLPNAIDPLNYEDRDDKAFRERFDLGDSPFVLFLGRLTPIKGPDLLVDAFSRLGETFQKYHLAVAGPNEGMQASLEKTCQARDISSRVHFIGHVSGKTKSQALHAASLLAIPSRKEAMSIVALEAGVCGTPVLLTAECGFAAVQEIGGGRVVPATAEGLAQGLSELLGDPAQLEKMGERLRDYCRKNHAWDSIVNRYLEYYRRITN